jgi:hypothetical protein
MRFSVAGLFTPDPLLIIVAVISRVYYMRPYWDSQNLVQLDVEGPLQGRDLNIICGCRTHNSIFALNTTYQIPYCFSLTIQRTYKYPNF